MSMNEYRFTVDPTESDEERERRWDEELTKLQASGMTIQGGGPDGDWPTRNEPEEGKTWEDFWNDPTGKFVEVYDLVPSMIAGQWQYDREAGMYMPATNEEEGANA